MAADVIVLPVRWNCRSMYSPNGCGSITPGSISFALRQKGSFSLLKMSSHHVALVTEVEMRDLWLLLEDGAHQAREVRIDVDDLLKLVQYQHDGALALAGELPRQLEQPLRVLR